MKFLRYGPIGSERPAMLDHASNIRDLSGIIDDLAGPTLDPETLGKLGQLDPETLPIIQPDRIGACVGAVGKFIGIGLNFTDHVEAAGVEVPTEPPVFMRATSAISGPNDPLILPRNSTKADWEVELGIVIGKHAKYVEEADAMDYIAGYCLMNDVTERGFQLERGGQWTKGKSCDSFGPIGPWLVTKDEVPDPQDMRLWLRLNGEPMQEGSTKTMIFGVSYLVSYLSQIMSLHPGDVITTGTPPGVGMSMVPQRFLKAGDVVELGIDGLGEQRQMVKNEDEMGG